MQSQSETDVPSDTKTAKENPPLQ